MEKKVVHQASEAGKFRDPNDGTKRVLDLLIAKDGAFRTTERWVWEATKDLVKQGVVQVEDESTLTIGPDFEQFLLKMSSVDSSFNSTLASYRALLNDQIDRYSVRDDAVMEKLTSLATADEKIVYLTSVLSETYAKTAQMIAKTTALEAKLAELDVALSVLESMTFDEDSDR